MDSGRTMLCLTATAMACLLGACTSNPDSFQGITLGAEQADNPLRALARRAAAGDKRAQLALGVRFETGDGIPVDLDRAERLYRMAAITSGDEQTVYYPGIRPKSQGKILPRWFHMPRYGLPAAQARLDALRRRRAGAPGGKP